MDGYSSSRRGRGRLGGEVGKRWALGGLADGGGKRE